MFLCTDTNFRLSNRLTRSTEKTDPTFNNGRGYMVRIPDFDDFLKSVKGNEDHIEPVRLLSPGRDWHTNGARSRATATASTPLLS